jgi:hypothetical protein
MPHLAALEIARRRRKPFVMDMRDPWSVAPALPNAYAHPLWYQLAEKYERRAAKAASLIIANTEALALALRRKYPEQADRVLTVMNGCDEEEIPAVQRDQFVISYAGNIYIDRDPRPLFRAIRRVVEGV